MFRELGGSIFITELDTSGNILLINNNHTKNKGYKNACSISLAVT
tara:strand:+ start:193 stop:327 length:135 start_codon:yes stop_codon:yes gene_type:complete